MVIDFSAVFVNLKFLCKFQKKWYVFLKNKQRKTMQSTENKILSRIYGHGRGWAFFAKDFSAAFGALNIDKALSDLTKQGKIRRICRGMYDYPKYSELLGQELSPDFDQVARAFARKFNWRIQPSGDAALNLLGLSTQVPGKYIYLSDGPNRSYAIGNYKLEFKKTVLKEVGFKHRESGIIVQALKALGKDRITSEVMGKVRKEIDAGMYPKILKDTRSATGWIYDCIKSICREGLSG